MKFEVIKADLLQNKKDIISLIEKNLGTRAEAWYPWKYKNCPCGNAYSWLIKESTLNNFIGTGTLFPRRLFLDGERIYAGIAGDFTINTEFRSLGPALIIQNTILKQKNNDLVFTYGLPNKASERVLLRAGYFQIGVMERLVKLLRTEYKLKEKIKWPFAVKVVSRILDFFCRPTFSQANRKKNRGFKLEMLDYFDGRFDRLWEEAHRQFDIIGERTSRFLEWRYKESPGYEYKVFSITKDSEIEGYLVYFIQNNISHVVDLLVSNFDEYFNALMSEFIHFSYRKGINSISVSYFGNSIFTKKLKELGFILREKDSKILAFTDDAFIKSRLLNKEKWYLLYGDNDV